MKKIILTVSALAIAGTLAFWGDADAGPGKGQGYKNSKQAVRQADRDDDVTIAVAIDLGSRDIIRDYLRDNYVRNCPPGLAKKHNGCLPPGQAKKRYRIGEYLAHDVEYSAVGRGLLDRLGPPPAGYMYVNVDKDILLISQATKKVVDAVTLLSAVGN